MRRLNTLGITAVLAALSGCRTTPAAPNAVLAANGPPAAARQAPVRMIAVGDLMLGTSVKHLILSKGATYPYRHHLDRLALADLTYGNLETPLSNGGSPTAGKSQESLNNGTNFIFRAPPVAARGLAKAGFDVVSVANNHTMDYGPTALRDTLKALSAAKVLAVGAGENRDAALQPVFLQRHGQRFAFFGISDILPAFSTASERTAGIAGARGAEFEKQMPLLIREAKKQADWVLVGVHWGQEGNTGATTKQKRLGRRLIDWGANVVIGAHTHVLGPVEHYHGGLIHYSLGNFVGYASSRKDVGLWRVVFRPGQPLTEESLTFDYKGKPVGANR